MSEADAGGGGKEPQKQPEKGQVEAEEMDPEVCMGTGKVVGSHKNDAFICRFGVCI